MHDVLIENAKQNKFKLSHFFTNKDLFKCRYEIKSIRSIKI